MKTSKNLDGNNICWNIVLINNNVGLQKFLFSIKSFRCNGNMIMSQGVHFYLPFMMFSQRIKLERIVCTLFPSLSYFLSKNFLIFLVYIFFSNIQFYSAKILIFISSFFSFCYNIIFFTACSFIYIFSKRFHSKNRIFCKE